MCSHRAEQSLNAPHTPVPPLAFPISASSPIPPYSLSRALGAVLFPSFFPPLPALWCQYPRHRLPLMLHSPVHPWLSYLQLSHWLLLREQPGFLDLHSPKELKAIPEHTKHLRDECGAVSAVCTVIHDCSVEEKLGTAYGPNYLCPPATNTSLFQIQFICAAWQLSWLPFFSWGTQPHAVLFIHQANDFCSHICPIKPASCPIQKVRIMICDCERCLGTFWKVNPQSWHSVSFVIAFCGPVVALS